MEKGQLLKTRRYVVSLAPPDQKSEVFTCQGCGVGIYRDALQFKETNSGEVVCGRCMAAKIGTTSATLMLHPGADLHAVAVPL